MLLKICIRVCVCAHNIGHLKNVTSEMSLKLALENMLV